MGGTESDRSFSFVLRFALTYFSGADVSWTHNVLHFAWHEQVSELFWERGRPLRDVNIAYDEDELPNTIHCHYFLIIKI